VWSLAEGSTPEAIHADAARVAGFQQRLVRDGFELRWPWDDAAAVDSP